MSEKKAVNQKYKSFHFGFCAPLEQCSKQTTEQKNSKNKCQWEIQLTSD
jgi:hypothetical protein